MVGTELSENQKTTAILLKVFDLKQLLSISITGLSLSGLVIGLTDIEVHHTHKFIIDKWNEVLLAITTVAYEPFKLLLSVITIHIFDFEIRFSDYYREIFVVIAFYCFNSIRISIQRKRWKNVYLSIFLLLTLTTLSSVGPQHFFVSDNRFAMAMFSFFIYDFFQALYDSNYHSPANQSKKKTFLWYFLVQIVWSLLAAIVCHNISVSLVNLGVTGGDIFPYLLLVGLLSLRNLLVGAWYVATVPRQSGQRILAHFFTSATARMGSYLGATLIFVAFFVFTGAGWSYYVSINSVQ